MPTSKPMWGASKDAKGKDKVAKVREMETIVKQKERDARKAAELAESQRQPHMRNRLHKRYNIGDGTTTAEVLDQFTGGAVEPEPEPEQIGGGGGGGGGGTALALSGGGGRTSPTSRPHASLPKHEQRERTKAEVDKLRRRLGEIERRNTMSLEEYFTPDDLVVAQQNLEQMKLNTTGYLARKVEEHKRASAQEAADKREREKSADVLTAASVGDLEQLRHLLADELQEYNGPLAPPSPSRPALPAKLVSLPARNALLRYADGVLATAVVAQRTASRPA